MANLNVPGRPRVARQGGAHVRLTWKTPATRGFRWNVYAAVAGVAAPLPGPPLNVAPIQAEFFTFSLTDVAGNNPPGNDLLVAITSVNEVNGQESAQSAILAVNVDAGDPCAQNRVIAGRSPSGQSTYLATDEDGRIFVSPDGDPIPVTGDCPLTSHFQTDVTVTTTAADIINSPAIVAPLAGRKMIILQNRGNQSVFLGTATLQNHELKAGGSRVLKASEISLGMYARIAAGAGTTVNVWEFA